jgi:hypothetical protein
MVRSLQVNQKKEKKAAWGDLDGALGRARHRGVGRVHDWKKGISSGEIIIIQRLYVHRVQRGVASQSRKVRSCSKYQALLASQFPSCLLVAKLCKRCHAMQSDQHRNKRQHLPKLLRGNPTGVGKRMREQMERENPLRMIYFYTSGLCLTGTGPGLILTTPFIFSK